MAKIDEATNRVTLPSDVKFSEKAITKMTTHLGKHNKDSGVELTRIVEDITEKFKDNIYTKEEAREKLLTAIEEEKQKLINGEIHLNNVCRR
jgi:hypothetical protein